MDYSRTARVDPASVDFDAMEDLMKRLMSVLAVATMLSTASLAVAHAKGSDTATTGTMAKEHKAPARAMHKSHPATSHHATHHSNAKGEAKSMK
jgi:hypothetical protein